MYYPTLGHKSIQVGVDVFNKYLTLSANRVLPTITAPSVCKGDRVDISTSLTALQYDWLVYQTDIASPITTFTTVFGSFIGSTVGTFTVCPLSHSPSISISTPSFYNYSFLGAVASEGALLFVVYSSISNRRGVCISRCQFRWVTC